MTHITPPASGEPEEDGKVSFFIRAKNLGRAYEQLDGHIKEDPRDISQRAYRLVSNSPMTWEIRGTPVPDQVETLVEGQVEYMSPARRKIPRPSSTAGEDGRVSFFIRAESLNRAYEKMRGHIEEDPKDLSKRDYRLVSPDPMTWEIRGTPVEGS